MSKGPERSLFPATIKWIEQMAQKARNAGAKYEIATQSVGNNNNIFGNNDICRATIFYPDGGIENSTQLFTPEDALFPPQN